MHNQIITSLLDTDLYKFTMMQCVFHYFKESQVEYRFIARKPIELESYAKHIREQIDLLCDLKFTQEELDYLATHPFFKPDFIQFLKDFKLNKSNVIINTQQGFDLHIKGSWLNTILFEVPLLAIVSECYYSQKYPEHDITPAKQRLKEKIEIVKNNAPDLRFTDFGTRRRFAKYWQDILIDTLKSELPMQFTGTSNVYFAKKYQINPIGTMAHEFLQACQVLAPDFETSQQFALETWLKEYPDTLGIALTDTITMDVFLSEFNATLANRFIGLRQDSGDPIQWGEKAIAYYESLGIDPKSKVFVFSDNLTIPKAIDIHNHFKGRVQILFGIGTNLTNDVGIYPLDIVLKMIYANGKPVIKISDSPGKMVCEDKQYLANVKKILHLKD